MGDDMSVENKEQEHIDGQTDSHVDVDKSKRKFSKAGIVSPVILGLASRPSWVMAADNCSFQAAVSGNISVTPTTSCTDKALSTRSPGVFKGVAGDGKWEEYGVGELRNHLFETYFTNSPTVEFKDGSPTTLELVIRASRKEFLVGQVTDFTSETVTYTNQTNKIFHYVGAFLMALSSSTPDDITIGIVHPYSAAEIRADWGVWNLYSKLQALQDVDMTVAEVNSFLYP